MELAAESLYLRVDLDGVDVLGTLGERDGDVVAVSGADDEHVVERPGDVPVREEVEGLDLRERRDRIRGLVRDVVRADREGVTRHDAADPVRRLLVDGGDLVVRRPVVVAVRRLDREQRDDRDECKHLGPPADAARAAGPKRSLPRRSAAPRGRTAPRRRRFPRSTRGCRAGTRRAAGSGRRRARRRGRSRAITATVNTKIAARPTQRGSAGQPNAPYVDPSSSRT